MASKKKTLSSQPSPVPAKRKGFKSHEWMILLTLVLASFLGRLDGTIVNLALPKIIEDFGITVSQASWISTAYIIANAIFVPVFGKLGDMIGRKPLYLFGIIGFTLTSMLAGLSFNLPSMVFFRVLQAITVSIDYPIALSILAFTFEDKQQRAQAMGMWSAVFAIAVVFGPLIGGPLVDNFSWRSVFYVNVPLGIIATLMAVKYIEEPVKKLKGIHNFDYFGSILLGVCLGVLVLVLDQGQSWGWASSNSLWCYVVSAVSLIAFIWIELREPEPVVDLKFFKNPIFTASIITSFLSFMGMVGGIFLIPLFAQNELGFSVTKTGYLFIPMAIAIGGAAQVGARLAAKIPPRFLVSTSMFFAAFGMYLLASIDIKWGSWDIIWRLFVMAFGLGIGLGPLTQAATASVPVQEVGVASSVLALARNIAGAFGTAIFATILSNSTTSNLLQIQKYSTIHTTDPAMLGQIVELMEVQANVLSYSVVFKSAVFFMIIGGLSAFLLRESRKDFAGSEHQPMEF